MIRTDVIHKVFLIAALVAAIALFFVFAIARAYNYEQQINCGPDGKRVGSYCLDKEPVVIP